MNQPSSQVFYRAEASKLFDTSDITPAVKFISALSKPPGNQRKSDFFCFYVANYPGSLSLKLIQIFASKEPRVLDEIRESAMRFLYVIFFVEKVSLNLATVQLLWTELFSCLEEQEISETSLKILSKLVDRFAFKLSTDLEWHDMLLFDFISSKAETKFVRAVSVFNNLSMPLNGEEFVIPLVEKLRPTILIQLKGEEKCLRDWCLAFVGGFCAVIQLLKTTRVDLVKNLADEMLNSVKRGMELGFMNMTLKEVEAVVGNQLWWYYTTELRFVKGLVQRIDEIITEQSTKNVLQEIDMAVENMMIEIGEVIDNNDEDWLNQRQ